MIDYIIGIIGARQNKLGDGDKGVALLQEGLQDSRKGLRGVLGGVVEEDDGAGLDPGGHPLGDVGR